MDYNLFMILASIWLIFNMVYYKFKCIKAAYKPFTPFQDHLRLRLWPYRVFWHQCLDDTYSKVTSLFFPYVITDDTPMMSVS